jgi:hypothetical protein
MVEVGESSQPVDVPQSRQPGQQQILPGQYAAQSATDPPNRASSAIQGRSSLPQARPTEDMDDSACGATPLSVPTQVQSTTPQTQYPGASIELGSQRPPEASSAVLEANNNTIRADSTDSTKRPTPRSLQPLDSKQPFGGQQLCCPSPGDSSLDIDFVEQEYQPDFAHSLSSVKRKRPHPKDEISQPSIADPDIVAATQDIIALLQMYGSLSHIQLKVNIETQFEGDELASTEKFQKVLDILVELGIIHIVEDLVSSSCDTKVASVADNDSKPDTINNNPVYSFGNGATRMDVVLPSRILDEIYNAGNEIVKTQQRIELLQSFLRVDRSPVNEGVENDKKSRGISSNIAPLTQEFAKKSLRQMVNQHPEVVHDPTYAAALRLFKVQDAQGTISGGSKKKQKAKLNNSSAVDMIAENREGNESPLMNSKRNEH